MISKWQLSHKKAFNLISHQGNMDFKILKYHFMLALKQSVIASIVCFFFKKSVFISFWLHWFFIAVRGLTLVIMSWD